MRTYIALCPWEIRVQPDPKKPSDQMLVSAVEYQRRKPVSGVQAAVLHGDKCSFVLIGFGDPDEIKKRLTQLAHHVAADGKPVFKDVPEPMVPGKEIEN